MSNRTAKRWTATSAWAGIASLGLGGAMREGPGVRLDLVDGRGLATIIVREGYQTDLARVLRERLGCDLPQIGTAIFGRDASLIWSAPGQWLATSPAPEALAAMPSHLAGIAAVTDQSDSRALIAVSGPHAREALQKGFAIDLHPSVFAVGSAATTKVAHISVQIWQLDPAPRYMIAVPRSFAGSFWSWLTDAAAAYGYEVAEGA